MAELAHVDGVHVHENRDFKFLRILYCILIQSDGNVTAYHTRQTGFHGTGGYGDTRCLYCVALDGD